MLFISRTDLILFVWLAQLGFFVFWSNGLKATMTYVPAGSNPLLYKVGIDPIIQFDQNTFADTIFDMEKQNGFVIEFYADWCGHCRALAPFYRQFANLVRNWGKIVQVAAVNCADNINSQICRLNGVAYFPMIKYYPRSTTQYSDGILMAASHSAKNLRDQLAGKVANEYNLFNYLDWPNLKYLEVNSTTTFEDLWNGVFDSANFLLIIFEQFETVGVQGILDLSIYQHFVGVRRALSNSPLVGMLRITSFPFAALFKRGDQQSVFMERFQTGTLDEVMNRVQPGRIISLESTPPTTLQRSKLNVIDCDRFPDRCKILYFVSEVDMLKALRMALLDEVTRMDGFIQGEKYQHLHAFLSLLSNHFPSITFDAGHSGEVRRARRSTSMVLRKSENAKNVFYHLKEMLERKQGLISTTEWRSQFENVERIFAYPFPRNATWQHCSGTSPEYRGYTCGLWVTFHTLTVHAYINFIKGEIKTNPLKPLRAIQGWVKSFFGCEDCRNHFMKMTTELYPMNEQRVKNPHDIAIYFWKAHNIVNNRLHATGKETEDPQFPKNPFPPSFLCPKCRSGGSFSRRQVQKFLLRYYTSIKPYSRVHSHSIGERSDSIGANGPPPIPDDLRRLIK